MDLDLVRICEEEGQPELISKLEDGLERIDALFDKYDDDMDPGLVIDILSIYKEIKPDINSGEVRIALEKAVRFHHKSKKRDKKNRPYVSHAFDVGYILAFLQRSDDVIKFGLFHDALEEHNGSVNIIKELIDKKRLNTHEQLVVVCELSTMDSDPNKDGVLYKRLNKHFDDGYEYLSIIKIADNISNLITKKHMKPKDGLTSEGRIRRFEETSKKYWILLAQRIDDKGYLNIKLAPYLKELVER
ncbi:hypothetical protein HQ529_05130 [Candidatus Woesearchaeota archaeon]|nr:hypothetical protein [Candidatus Woesearchaeota archaeon]